MEVEAHTHAIQWLASQLDEQITHAIILTDSMNLLQKVESGMGCTDWHTAMHSLRLQTFLWIYCPRHVGVSGNKQADRLTTYLRPSLPVEHRPSTTPRHRTLFWAALAIPDQLVTCCFSSTSVYCLQLLRGWPLFLFPCGLQVRAWCVVLDAGFLRVCPIQPHFHRSICLATGSCCVSLVSTRKEARWSAWFFSLLTVGNEGYVQQTNKQNWTLNSNEQKVLRSHSKYIKPKNVPERETTRMLLNS